MQNFNKRFFLSAGVIGVFIAYAIHLKTDVEEHLPITIRPQPTTIANDPTPTATASNSGLSPIPKLSGKYKDGTYTGSVADAFYGNIQVKVVITEGKINDVIFLQYPNDRRTSIEINQQAIPLLKQEAIQVQSTKVSGVSGATASSDAFVESLGSALKQAV